MTSRTGTPQFNDSPAELGDVRAPRPALGHAHPFPAVFVVGRATEECLPIHGQARTKRPILVPGVAI